MKTHDDVIKTLLSRRGVKNRGLAHRAVRIIAIERTDDNLIISLEFFSWFLCIEGDIGRIFGSNILIPQQPPRS